MPTFYNLHVLLGLTTSIGFIFETPSNHLLKVLLHDGFLLEAYLMRVKTLSKQENMHHGLSSTRFFVTLGVSPSRPSHPLARRILAQKKHPEWSWAWVAQVTFLVPFGGSPAAMFPFLLVRKPF